MSLLDRLRGKSELHTAAAAVFADPPELTTARLRLVKIVPAFAADMYEYAHDPAVTKFLTWPPHVSRLETVRYIDILQKKYADGSFHDWGLVYKENNKFIGTCGYTSFDASANTAEIGYVLNKAYWGKGLAAEAAKEVMRFGFDTFGLDGFTAKHIEGNEASGSVMRKCGMHLEGVYRHSMYIKGEFRNIAVYKISRKEFDSLQNPAVSPL